MVQAKGSQAQLLGGVKEVTFGTTPGTPTAYTLPVISSNITGTQQQINSNVIRGGRNPTAPSNGNKSVAGQVVVPVDLINIGYWLQMALGDPTTTGSGDPYTHVFKVGDSLDSWVLEQGYTDINQYQEFNGCKVNSLAFSFDATANSELTATAQVEGATEALDTSSIDATPTAQSVTPLEIGDLAIKEGGSTIGSVRSIDFTIGNNLDTGNYVVGGGGQRGAISEGLCQITGTMTALFEDQTLLSKAKDSTETSLELTLTQSTHSLKFDINELLYSYQSPGIQGPQGILQTLSFAGYYDNGAAASVIAATLVNSLDAYVS